MNIGLTFTRSTEPRLQLNHNFNFFCFLLSQIEQIKPNLSAVDVTYLRTHPGVSSCSAAEPCGVLQALPASPLTQTWNSPTRLWSSRVREASDQLDKKRKKSHYSGNLCGSEINSAVCNSVLYYSKVFKRFLLTARGIMTYNESR